MQLQFRIIRHQYSTERICAAIGDISIISTRVILITWCQIQRISSSLRYLYCGPDDIECNYSSAYSGYNIQLIVSPLLLDICRKLNARYTANLEQNTAHIVQFTLCELCSRTYTMHLEIRIFRLRYSAERICTAIVDILTSQCAL
jgi:hypothetical protein